MEMPDYNIEKIVIDEVEYIRADIVKKLEGENERMRTTLEKEGYSDCGGELWKPPIGPSASPLLDLITSLRFELDKAVEMLREIDERGRSKNPCPFCPRGYFSPHDPDCRLATFLQNQKGL